MKETRTNNKHYRKLVPRENKWWYRYIRGMSWFSFRYWWFNWLVFLACIFLFWWFCPCTQETPVKKCSTNINEHINDINAIMDSCCDCNTIVEPPEPPEPPAPPEGSTPCDNKVVSDELISGDTNSKEIYLGPNPGRVSIRFDMNGWADKMEVIYNGTVIKNTGFVRNGGSFSFDYSPVPNIYYVVVKITGGDEGSPTVWEYTVGCPN